MKRPSVPTVTPQGHIRWLTELPSHWQVVPSKWLFSESKERAREGDQQLSATQAYGVIPQAEFEELEGRQVVHVFKHLDKRKHVRVDDFVISMRSFQGGLERARAHGCIRSSYVVLRPGPSADPGYFAHLFKSSAYIQALQATSNYIRDGQDLNWTNFTLVNLPLAPMAEQRAIADFLDHKTAALDALIEKKARLVELLAERRAALIHRAVTRGLDPDVQLKDSGVDWIGPVPTKWVVARLSFRYQQQLGKMLSPEAASGPHQAPYLGNRNVQWDYVDTSDLNTMSFSPGERMKFGLREGDLLVCEGGAVGRTAVWRNETKGCFFQKAVHRLRPQNRSLEHPRFFYYCMRAATDRGLFEEQGNKATIGHLTGEALRAHKFPFPSQDEQREIADRLDTVVGHLTEVEHRLLEQIAKLQEYRQALITAAVTGQLDIPEAAA